MWPIEQLYIELGVTILYIFCLRLYKMQFHFQPTFLEDCAVDIALTYVEQSANLHFRGQKSAGFFSYYWLNHATM